MSEVHDSAPDVQAFLADNPGGTVAEIAEATGIPQEHVISILDTHIVSGDGEMSYAGEGQGGGFVPAESTFEPSTFIGYRWPDGSLHLNAFDANDAAHLAAVGLVREEGAA